ncbi:hypothetical protein BRADI_1g77491v3 [Brachypodium distachyon]|uniref:Uncharacterized protein n=1 Tax=Brachypodium distachyon TaxID=15368 RepID=A0A2K2DVM3_BRADI|nr:hypothetical protein BRADI_1g77491v3 [Brachypodium distachyon]
MCAGHLLCGKVKHLVVPRNGRIKGKEHAFDAGATGPRHRRRAWQRQASIPQRGRVAHIDIQNAAYVARPDEEQAVAVLLHAAPVVPKERTAPAAGGLAGLARRLVARGRRAEQGRLGLVPVVGGEDAGELAREDVRKDEAVGVDDAAP